MKKKLMLLAAMMLVAMLAFAAPAIADDDRHDNRFDNDRHDNRFDNDRHGNRFDNRFNVDHEVCWWEWSWVFEEWQIECY